MKDTFGIDNPALPTLYPGALFRWLLSEGYSADALLQDTQIIPSKLLDGDSIISFRQQRQLISNSIRLSNNPHLGIAFGHQLSISAHGMLGFAAMSSSTLGGAIELIQKYFSTRAPLFTLSLETGEDCKLVINESLNFGDIRYFLLESFLCSTIKALHFLLGQDQSMISASVCYEEPNTWAAASAKLNVNFEIRYGQEKNAVIFPQHYLDKPLTTGSSSGSKSTLEAYEELLDSSPMEVGLISRIKSMLRHQEHTFYNLSEIASELCVSPRTLRRELAKLDVSYQKILDDVKKQRALEKLTQTTLPISEIGNVLGFSDPSNFSRAFRKWTGMSPNSYRVLREK